MKFIYLAKHHSDKKHRNLLGCVAFSALYDKKKIKYALSVCSPKDRFCKRVAREIAQGRVESGFLAELPWNDTMTSHDVVTSIMKDIIKRNDPSLKMRSETAYVAATEWLQLNSRS